jgi:hypothetical protein
MGRNQDNKDYFKTNAENLAVARQFQGFAVEWSPGAILGRFSLASFCLDSFSAFGLVS